MDRKTSQASEEAIEEEIVATTEGIGVEEVITAVRGVETLG